MGTRARRVRGFRARCASLLTALTLLGTTAGCTADRPPTPDEAAEVTLTRSGGVAGLREVLHVRPDGVAVRVGEHAGRVGASRLTELRARLADPDLRDEAAATARGRDDDARCSDLISRSLTVGGFSMSVTDACGDGRRPRTPAFDAVLELLADPAAGRFDEPLRAGDVPRLTLRTEQSRTGQEPYAVTADPDGVLVLSRPGRPDQRARLDAGDRDVLALTGLGLLGQPATACPGGTGAVVTVVGADGSRASGTPCAFGARTADAIAVHRALTRHFELG